MADGTITCPHCGAASSSSAALCYNCNGDLHAPAGAAVSATARTATVSHGGVDYDPRVIQSYARAMYSRASMIVVLYSLGGAVAGAALLGFAGAALGSAEGGLLIGGLAGAALGAGSGTLKANALRLEAQMALCQVEIEQNTRR